MISWKNSFKRLNEEYELAKKKKQAVDNLYITGKISQFTRDSFNKDISATIVDIERQQKDLLAKMHLKTDELSCQIKTLETLLANYEIQYVIGEIEEDAYQRDSFLFTAGIDAAKNELETIKQATMQLCAPVPTVQAPVAPELSVATPVIETTVMESAPVETSTPVEFSLPIETPVETPTFETAPAPIIEETIEEQTFAAADVSVVEEPVVDAAPLEEIPTIMVEEPVMDVAPFEEVAPVVEESVMDSALFDDVSVVEEPVMDVAPFEEVAPVIEEAAPIASADILIDEPAIEIAATEPVFLTAEPVVEAPVMDYTPVEEAQIEETNVDITATAAPEEIVTDIPLQVFEVTEQAPIEQTLEKVMEQLNSPVVETLTVEELTHDSHPSTAPHQAPSDIIAEAVNDGQIEESDEDTTE